MKKSFTFLVFLLVVFNNFGQNSKLSASVSYPVTISDDFFDSFKGVLDLGLEYNFYNSSKISVGASLNANLFTKHENLRFDPSISVDQNLTVLQPRGYVSYSIAKGGKIKPFAGIGYSLVFLKANINNPNYEGNPKREEKENNDYLNLNFGIAYDVMDNLFLVVQFDRLKGINNEFDNFRVPETMGTLKFGVGYRF